MTDKRTKEDIKKINELMLEISTFIDAKETKVGYVVDSCLGIAASVLKDYDLTLEDFLEECTGAWQSTRRINGISEN